MVLAPRAAVTMTGTGAAIGYGSSWHDLRGSLPTNGTYGSRPESDVEGVVWHHSASRGQSIRNLAQYHTMVRGWPGIAYHFAIGWDGVIYQMNDVTTLSYHAQGYNSKTIGVVLVGNYEEREITDEMAESIVMLNEYLKDRYSLKFAWTHCETKATICPGKYAREMLDDLLYGDGPKSVNSPGCKH